MTQADLPGVAANASRQHRWLNWGMPEIDTGQGDAREGTGKRWGTDCPLAVELGMSAGTAKEGQREIKICRRASNRPE
jgi:hypothetical protein